MAENTVEDYVAAQEKEYGQYVAIDLIHHGYALAYNPGDPVPASNVDAHGYVAKGVVAKRSTKAAAAVIAERSGGGTPPPS